jgi:hypothetical protein
MEAMRLSLVDHEEHQQREADRRRNENTRIDIPSDPSSSVSASCGPELTSSTPSPPTSHIPSRASDSNVDSVVPSSLPAEIPVTTQINIGSARAPSFNNVDNSSPPRFSPLRAAMSATSTASPVLGDRKGVATPPSEAPTVVTAGTTGNTNTRSTTSRSRPTPAEVISTPLQSINDLDEIPFASQGASTADAESFMSQESAQRERASSYDVLQSSPESEFSREPLLGEMTSTETESRENSVG